MRWTTVTTALFLLVLVSCKREETYLPINKEFVPLSGSQLVPAKSLAAEGYMNYVYNKGTRVLTYTIFWKSLSGVPSRIAIYGPAARGFSIFPPLTTNAIQTFSSGFPLSTGGSYTGTLFVDNVRVKESDLLQGEFYALILTAANPTGEIRGQIEF